MTLRLPGKDSAVGRALRVLVYQVPMLVLALLNNASTVHLLLQYYPGLTTIMLGTAPLVAFLYNMFRKDVKNY